MRKFAFIILAMLFAGCVQETRKVTVAYHIVVNDIANIKSVGVRGSDKPLSWESDLPLEPMVKDSLYRAYVTYNTGYRFTEVKFVVNDTFELNGMENRRVIFSEKDTTVYNALYNVGN